MKLSITVLLIVISILAQSQLNAQTVNGIITDAETGEALQSATVLIEGTYRGTISNIEGEFTIRIDEYPALLLFRYIGYESKQVRIEKSASIESLTVSLIPSIAELDEIVVTEKDPGLSIMELVIARKKLWRANLESYEAEAFSRQVLSNDTSIVSITESGSRAYWDHERGRREVQLYKQQTSNLGENQNFAGVSLLPNFYDDDIEISGYRVMGITHPDAPGYYYFRLLETLQMDGKPLYKIEVEPRRKLQPLFRGVVWVLGRDYALIEVELKPNEVVNFPPPVQEFNLAYKQQFSNYGGEFWLPVDMRIDGTIRIGMVGLRFPPMNFRQTSRISDYRVNVPVPDSLYLTRSLITMRIADDANRLAEREFDSIPLTIEEEIAYNTIDSTKTLDQAFKPEGFLARMLDNSDEQSVGMGPASWMPSGLGAELGYNRVNGFKAGLKYNFSPRQTGFRSEVNVLYNINSSDWDYGFEARQRVTKRGFRRPLYAELSYSDKTDQRLSSGLYPSLMNSMTALSGGNDYFDYYRNESVYAGVEWQRFIRQTTISAGFRHENHTSSDPAELHDFSLFGWHEKRRVNPLIEDGRLNAVVLKLKYNPTSNDFGFSGSRSFSISVEHSESSLNSDFDFTNLTFALNWNWETFYQRRLFSNMLDLKVRGGYAFGDLPLQRYGAVDGSLNRFTPFGVLKTRNGIPYEGSEYWQAAMEHNFRSIPFEFFGFRSLADKGWGVIVFAGAGYSKTSEQVMGYNPMISDGVHSEAGISLNSVFSILRIDFAKRLDASGTYIGFSVPRYF